MRKILVTYVVLLVCVWIHAQKITVPWTCGFEEDETAEISQWFLNPGTSGAQDQWVVGKSVRSERKQSLYISTDNGLTASHGSKRNIVIAYRLINLPERAKEYDVSFDYRQPSDKGALYVFFDYSSSLIFGTDEYQLLQYANSTRADGIPKRVLEKARYVTSSMPSTSASRSQVMKNQTGWRNVSLDAGEGTNYSDRFTTNTSKRQMALVFMWVNTSDTAGMGACIDNVQIASATVAKPTDLQASYQCADSSITITWKGGLDGYLVGYRKSTSGFWRTFTYTGPISNIQHTYTVTGLKDGLYDFRVCGWKRYYDGASRSWVSDTTGYVSVSNFMLYCPENQCINFADLEHADCTYGTNKDLYEHHSRIDYGWEDMWSIHTVNTDPNAYDIRAYDPETKEQLRIVPENAMVSVRLGNWRNPSDNAKNPGNTAGKSINGQTIKYSFVVDSANAAILMLRYAMVFSAYPNPNHPKDDSPFMRLSVLDEFGNVIDDLCGTQEFYCPAYKTTTQEEEYERQQRIINERWHIYKKEDFPVYDTETKKMMGFDSSCDIWWKDWSTMGLNLSQYDGQLLQVVIESQGCTESAHYGYGYFTLGCASATIETDQCGNTPTATADAPDGFEYQWYAKDDAELFNKGLLKDPTDGHSIIVSREPELTVNAGDTKTYVCHLSYLDSPDCFFELETVLLPRNPLALHTYTITPEDCKNLLMLKDSSKIVSYDEYGKMVIMADDCDYSQWSLRSLTTGNKTNFSGTQFTYEALQSGDTVVVTHTAYISDGECDNVLIDTIYMPDITTPDSTIFDTICDNHRYSFAGKTYNRTGTYYDSLINRYGCDSVRILELHVKPTSMVNRTDTICTTALPYLFSGTYHGEPKQYEFSNYQNYITSNNYVIKLDNRYDCDSTINLELTIIPLLQTVVDTIPVLCSDEKGFNLEYHISQGDFDSLRITFSPTAYEAGLRDTTFYHDPYSAPIIPPVDGLVHYDYPDTVLPDMYYMYVQFYQHPCCRYTRIDTIPIDIRYANSIIVQKWDDVLALLNKDYNVNHASFSAYQWYKNDEPIEGATGPYLYNGTNLDFGAEYKVLLTREKDGVQQFTCPIVPVRKNIPENSYPTILQAGSLVPTRLETDATVAFYSLTGTLYSQVHISAGESAFVAPAQIGYYILCVEGTDGKVTRQKILITP